MSAGTCSDVAALIFIIFFALLLIEGQLSVTGHSVLILEHKY